MSPDKNGFSAPFSSTRPDKVVLMAVGDIMLGETPLMIGHGVRSKIREKGAIHPFLRVASLLKEGDIVFGNLEAVLSDKGLDRSKLNSVQIRATPESVDGLKYAGINLLSLANNHIFEHGKEAFYETTDLLSKNNISYFGVNDNKENIQKPLVINTGGVKIACLAFCLFPGETTCRDAISPEAIVSDISQAKKAADIVVVSLHWGDEYIKKPSPVQVKMAHKMVDAGANLILGHHPHVLQGIERYKDGFIAYSLGNFVCDMSHLDTRESMVLRIGVSKTGIDSLEIMPVYINKNYQPYILNRDLAEIYRQKIDKLTDEISAYDENDLTLNIKRYNDKLQLQGRLYRSYVRRYLLTHIYR
ncbi:CapA family protein [Chloroflexota bacterium]